MRGAELHYKLHRSLKMEKLGRDLKKGFLSVVEAITGNKSATGDDNKQESKSETVEEVTVQERAIKVAARGPTRPSAPKGGSAQTG